VRDLDLQITDVAEDILVAGTPPPPGGSFFLVDSKSRARRMRNPHAKQHPKLIDLVVYFSWGFSSLGLKIEKPLKKKNPPGKGISCDQYGVTDMPIYTFLALLPAEWHWALQRCGTQFCHFCPLIYSTVQDGVIDMSIYTFLPLLPSAWYWALQRCGTHLVYIHFCHFCPQICRCATV